MHNSSYFDIVREPKNEAAINTLLAENTVQFAVTIPVIFRANCCAARNRICCSKPMRRSHRRGLRDRGDERPDADGFES